MDKWLELTILRPFSWSMFHTEFITRCFDIIRICRVSDNKSFVRASLTERLGYRNPLKMNAAELLYITGQTSQLTMTSSNGNILPRYWPFVRGINRSPVHSHTYKGQWRAAFMFSLICARINVREAGNLRRHRGHHAVIVMCMCFVGNTDYAVRVMATTNIQLRSITTNLWNTWYDGFIVNNCCLITKAMFYTNEVMIRLLVILQRSTLCW